MCGFTGYISLKNTNHVEHHVIKDMLSVIHHRGPDDTGYLYFTFNPAIQYKITNEPISTKGFLNAIGFKRLSIVDLSTNAKQPMISSTQKTIIVFNGEIYNAFSFRKGLENNGYIFKSKSDTEIILALYEKYDINGLLDRIIGMFAIVLIDLEKSTIYFIRDHFGIKPFYYYITDNEILFSSELKTFYYYPTFRAELNEPYLSEYLLFKYVSYPDTLLKNVQMLPPATYIKITPENITSQQYWCFSNVSALNISYTEALTHIDYMLKQSVKQQLLGDVKIGCQLSGGIDSSLITNYAREYFNAYMDTFSIVFKEKDYTEKDWIEKVNLKTESDSHLFLFTEKYFDENLYKATWHLDQPIHLPNTIAIKMLSERAKPLVTVLLSGEGADELFAGYTRFFDLYFRYKYEKKLLFLLNTPFKNKIINRYYLNFSLMEYAILSSTVMNLALLEKLLDKKNYIEQIIEKRKNFFPSSNNLLNNFSIYEMKTYMVDLLIRQDKMTMAHSVENRVPFLDKNLVEFVLSLPDTFKINIPNSIIKFNNHHHSTKKLLKDLAIKNLIKPLFIEVKKDLHYLYITISIIKLLN